MALIKSRGWVTDLNEEEGTLSAEIVFAEELDMGNARHFVTWNLDELKEQVSESDFKELTYMGGPMSHTSKVLPDLRQGRIFELHNDDEDDDYAEIHVPEFKPYTDEEIKRAGDRADEWSKMFKEK